MQWRNINQEGRNHVWKILSETMEEEVLEKYKVEESKRGTYKGKSEPSEWRVVQRVKKVVTSEVAWRLLGDDIFLYNMNSMADMTRKIKAKDRMDAKNSW